MRTSDLAENKARREAFADAAWRAAFAKALKDSVVHAIMSMLPANNHSFRDLRHTALCRVRAIVAVCPDLAQWENAISTAERSGTTPGPLLRGVSNSDALRMIRTLSGSFPSLTNIKKHPYRHAGVLPAIVVPDAVPCPADNEYVQFYQVWATLSFMEVGPLFRRTPAPPGDVLFDAMLQVPLSGTASDYHNDFAERDALMEQLEALDEPLDADAASVTSESIQAPAHLNAHGVPPLDIAGAMSHNRVGSVSGSCHTVF